MIVQITKPDSVNTNHNALFMFEAYPAVTKQGQERLDKGKPQDRYVVDWDDTITSVPSEATVEADYVIWEAAKAQADQEALDHAANIADKLTGLTDAQIDNYIDSNVTDLASARTYLKRLTKATRSVAIVGNE